MPSKPRPRPHTGDARRRPSRSNPRARADKPRGPHPPRSLAWALKYLPDYFIDQPSRFHAEFMATMQDPKQRLIARVAPRGHAKSTCASFAYPLWCICEKKRRNIVIVTHESSLALQFVRDIRLELESNERICADYGDLCAEAPDDEGTNTTKQGATRKRKTSRARWSAGLFTTGTGVTVQAKGSGAGLRGIRVGPQRPDLIICDDIEKDELVYSPESRQKLEQWLRRVVMPALAPDGQLLVLGSLIHYDSLLANLRDRQRFPRWDYRVYRALEAEPNADGSFRRVALWPDRWPVEKLDIERQRIGTLAFEQEYQANPIDDALRAFKPQWLKRYEQSELVEERLLTIMAVDPATGVSGGDFFALWVGSIDTGTGTIYTRELILERIGIVEQVKRIIAAFRHWKPLRIGIETVAYQVALKQILEEESRRRGLYMPLVAIQTSANKRARIEGSTPFYENGTFRLPANIDPEIEQQFLHFPKARHDDAPDVCAMGIELARALHVGGHIETVSAGRNRDSRREGW